MDLLNSILDRVEFIDLGVVGNTGEWADGALHPYDSRVLSPVENSAMVAMLNACLAAFPDTYVLAEALTLFHSGVFQSKVAAGVLPAALGWRSDHWGTSWPDPQVIGSAGSFVWSFSGSCYWQYWRSGLCSAHPMSPVALEIGGSYDVDKSAPLVDELETVLIQESDDTSTPSAEQLRWSVDQALNAGASYIYLKTSDLTTPSTPTAVADELRRLAFHLGYRLVVTEVRHPQSAPAGRSLTIRLSLVNRGVAACYGEGPNRPYEFVLRLRHVASGNTWFLRTFRAAHDVTPMRVEFGFAPAFGYNAWGSLGGPYPSSGDPSSGLLVTEYPGATLVEEVNAVAPPVIGVVEFAVGLVRQRDLPGGGAGQLFTEPVVAPVRLAVEGAQHDTTGWWHVLSQFEVT